MIQAPNIDMIVILATVVSDTKTIDYSDVSTVQYISRNEEPLNGRLNDILFLINTTIGHTVFIDVVGAQGSGVTSLPRVCLLHPDPPFR